VLAREARFAALSQLNTRVGSDMTAYRSDARILPNTDRDKYHSVVELLRDPGDSPDTAGLPEAPRSGSPTLTSVLASMTDDGSAPPSAGFDVPTLDFLDTHPGLGSCDQLVSAGALGVLPPGTSQDGVVAQYLAGGPLAS
jgi:hypothetical protein